MVLVLHPCYWRHHSWYRCRTPVLGDTIVGVDAAPCYWRHHSWCWCCTPDIGDTIVGVGAAPGRSQKSQSRCTHVRVYNTGAAKQGRRCNHNAGAAPLMLSTPQVPHRRCHKHRSYSITSVLWLLQTSRKSQNLFKF